MRTLVASALLGLVASVNSVASAQWSATSLHPAGATVSSANAAWGGQQFGTSQGHAAMWSGSAGSFVDLHPNLPPQFVPSSNVLAANGTQQGGTTTINVLGFGNVQHATLWTGTAASWTSLHPSGDSSNSSSYVYGVGGGRQVGVWQQFGDGNPPGGMYAMMWSGTAASRTFLSGLGSRALGTDGVQQVGSANEANSSDPFRAAMWTGTAASQLMLHPVGATSSLANGVANGRQIGWVKTGSVTHAGYWTGSADSWVDLNPVGASYSEARGIVGDYVVGKATFGGVDHAGLWTITTGAWIDLNAYMPANSQWSEAFGVSIQGNTLSVVGDARITEATGSLMEAYLWTGTVPAPGSLGVLAGLGVLIGGRRRRLQT